jgi:hypothetical protein
MNWDAIAAVAEVIGVVGVIVSIAYLGIQVRKGNRLAEGAAFEGVFSNTLSHIRGMIDGEHRDAVIKGLVRYDELVGSEKMTFDMLFLGLFTVIESALFSNDMQFLRDGTPDNFGYHLRTRLLPYSGTLSWWSDSKGVFPPEVQSWVESEISKADMNSDFFGIKKDAQ